jgi:hypothetical protein
MGPNEHLEKRNKEFGKWVEDVCRECKHKRLFHLYNQEDRFRGKYVHSNCNFLLEVGGFCSCNEWQSPDNLEYIELLAKRKGLIPDEDKKDNL